MEAHVLFQAMGNHLASARRPGRGPSHIHHQPCLPPFPVPCPGATRCSTALVYYACCVPMRPAGHNGPSPSCPCTCRPCTGKRQGKVDGQVATTRIRKLSCCQNVIAPLSEE